MTITTIRVTAEELKSITATKGVYVKPSIQKDQWMEAHFPDSNPLIDKLKAHGAHVELRDGMEVVTVSLANIDHSDIGDITIGYGVNTLEHYIDDVVSHALVFKRVNDGLYAMSSTNGKSREFIRASKDEIKLKLADIRKTITANTLWWSVWCAEAKIITNGEDEQRVFKFPNGLSVRISGDPRKSFANTNMSGTDDYEDHMTANMFFYWLKRYF